MIARRDLAGELRVVLGRGGRVTVEPRALAACAADFSDRDLGTPSAVAMPRTHQAVERLVRWARRRRKPLTPIGGMTSCWASVDCSGRVAVDLRGLDRVVRFDAAERTVTAEAGISVRTLEDWLAARGFMLGLCPDGFGQATLASLVANDATAGHRAFMGPASRDVVSMRFVAGTGDTLEAGAGRLFRGLSDFTRSGVPDLTGPLLASEGALGIITEITMRAHPKRHLRRLQARYPSSLAGFEAVRSLTQRLRSSGVFDGVILKSACAAELDVAEFRVVSGFCEEELELRCRRLEEELRRAGLTDLVRAPEAPLWEPPLEDGQRLKGVCVDLPYRRGTEAFGFWLAHLRPRLERLGGGGSGHGALSVYFHPDGLTFAMGWNHSPSREAASRALMRAARSRWLRWGVPYRIGRSWREDCRGRLSRSYLRCMDGLKALLDPDGILNPGVGVFGLAGRRA